MNYIKLLGMAWLLASLGCPQPSPKGKQCYGPPVSYQSRAMGGCFTAKSGATCCGYAYFPTANMNEVCFHLLCQEAPCEDWEYFKTECFDKDEEPEDQDEEESEKSDTASRGDADRGPHLYSM